MSAMIGENNKDALEKYLRDQLKDSKHYLNISGIARDIEITPQALGQFLNQKAALSKDTLDRLQELLELVPAGLLDQAAESTISYTGAIKCPSCNLSNPAEYGHVPAHYCLFCGESLGRECPNLECGHYNPPESLYCGICRTPLTEEAAEAAGMAKEAWEQLADHPKPGRYDRPQQKKKSRRQQKARGDIEY